MNDYKKNARKIGELAAEDDFQGRALILGQSASPEAMASILHAIDNTILLRNAVFSVGDRSVTLRVSGKRLLNIVTVSGDLDLSPDLAKQLLSATSVDTLKQIAIILRRLTSGVGKLRLERIPVEVTIKPTHSGVGTDALSDIWNVDLDVEQLDPIARFFATCREAAISSLTVGRDQSEQTHGTPDTVADLKQIIDQDWPDFERAHREISSSKDKFYLRIFDTLAPADQALMVVITPEVQHFSVVPTNEMPKVLAAWALACSS
jgi:hypothetical protein